MSRLRAWILVSSLGVLGLGSACRPKATAAPYAPGAGPQAQALIDGAKPQLDAIAVSEAKVVANRTLRGNLAFLAQGPGRFRGSVQISGNELVTLSFTEQGYALRYKLDAFPTGFYHGPPSACAVEALLGVALDTEDLVALVLGGAPIIGEPYEIADQGWDSAVGREVITIRNARYMQRLEFAPQGEGWQFAGSKLWRRAADGSRGAWMWSLSHEEMTRHGAAMLPTRTRVLAPGKRKNNLIIIHYKSRDLDPAFARTTGDGGSGDGGADGGEGGGADDWGADDGAWEGDDDGAWEGEPAGTAAAPTEAEPGESGAGTPQAAKPAHDPSQAAKPEAAKPEAAKPEPAKPASTVPAVFTIAGTGLSDRGDLCR